VGRGCGTNGEKRNAYRTLVGKPERRRPLGSPRSRWVYNIKKDLLEIGRDGIIHTIPSYLWLQSPILIWLRIETNGELL
jgi:hypothetical protein